MPSLSFSLGGGDESEREQVYPLIAVDVFPYSQIHPPHPHQSSVPLDYSADYYYHYFHSYSRHNCIRRRVPLVDVDEA